MTSPTTFQPELKLLEFYMLGSNLFGKRGRTGERVEQSQMALLPQQGLVLVLPMHLGQRRGQAPQHARRRRRSVDESPAASAADFAPDDELIIIAA